MTPTVRAGAAGERRLTWRQLHGGSMGNHLYYGDNLAVLREQLGDESVDLIKALAAR